MAKIVFLGTAAAIASRGRDNTSILIKTGKQNILIDCPGSPLLKLERLNIDYQKISNILLTHSHIDHIYGLFSLLHSQYKLNNIVRIFGHKKTIATVRILRKIFHLQDTSKYPKVIFREVSPFINGPFYDSKNLSILAFKVNHTKESLGFKFFFKNKKLTLVFSGDTAPCPNLTKEAKETNYLIHDCFATSGIFKKYPQLNYMHTSSLALGKIAKDAKVKNLIPIHFETVLNFSFKTILKEIKRNFKGRVIIPEDLGYLELIKS